eukprot:356171-Hanusia_phi.AAC.8
MKDFPASPHPLGTVTYLPRREKGFCKVSKSGAESTILTAWHVQVGFVLQNGVGIVDVKDGRCYKGVFDWLANAPLQTCAVSKNPSLRLQPVRNGLGAAEKEQQRERLMKKIMEKKQEMREDANQRFSSKSRHVELIPSSPQISTSSITAFGYTVPQLLKFLVLHTLPLSSVSHQRVTVDVGKGNAFPRTADRLERSEKCGMEDQVLSDHDDKASRDVSGIWMITFRQSN